MPGIPTTKTRNLIFDLGGVLLNINPLLSLLEFGKISGLSQEELRNRLFTEHLFENFDTGNYSPERFRGELCRIMDRQVSDEEIDRAWNKLLLDFPQSRVELLVQLSKNYRLFLLSNTNIIHFAYYTAQFYDTYGIQMTDLFETLFLSYQIGIHKPDTEIYAHVLQTAQIDPAETAFFDDSYANIEAAEMTGITGIHIHDGYDITDFFSNGFLK